MFTWIKNTVKKAVTWVTKNVKTIALGISYLLAPTAVGADFRAHLKEKKLDQTIIAKIVA